MVDLASVHPFSLISFPSSWSFFSYLIYLISVLSGPPVCSLHSPESFLPVQLPSSLFSFQSDLSLNVISLESLPWIPRLYEVTHSHVVPYTPCGPLLVCPHVVSLCSLHLPCRPGSPMSMSILFITHHLAQRQVYHRPSLTMYGTNIWGAQEILLNWVFLNSWWPDPWPCATLNWLGPTRTCAPGMKIWNDDWRLGSTQGGRVSYFSARPAWSSGEGTQTKAPNCTVDRFPSFLFFWFQMRPVA